MSRGSHQEIRSVPVDGRQRLDHHAQLAELSLDLAAGRRYPRMPETPTVRCAEHDRPRDPRCLLMWCTPSTPCGYIVCVNKAQRLYTQHFLPCVPKMLPTI
jgi:hypothetical protein